MKKNIAVILAGGVGSRLGLSTPKQFFKVAGKMVVEHTVDAFERNPHIDEIAIVSNPFYISEFENIVIKNGWKKIKKILKGGKERYDSSLSAIEAEHERRYRQLLANVEANKVFEKDEAIMWQCRNCGFVFEGKKAPAKCPACAHPQAYFEPMKQNY